MRIGKLGSDIVNSSDLDKSLKPTEPINKDGSMSVDAYREALQKKFPGYQLGVGAVSQGSIPAGSRTITIAPNVMQAMAADPEVAAKYEELLSDYVNTYPQFERMRAAEGQETLASGVFINADGTAGGYVMTRSKNTPGDRKTTMQSLNDLLAKTQERRELRMKRQKELQEVREARKQAEMAQIERTEEKSPVSTEAGSARRIDLYA